MTTPTTDCHRVPRQVVSLPGFRVTDWAMGAGTGSGVHRHARPVLSVTLTGRFEHLRRGNGRSRVAASAHAMPVGEPHSHRVGTVPTRALMIAPDWPTLERLGRAGEIFESPRALPDPRIGELAWRTVAEMEGRDDLWRLAMEGLILEMVSVAARSRGRRAATRPGWLDDVLDLLHERFPVTPTIATLAGAVGTDRRELSRSFRRHTHVSISGYVRRLRLERACRLLADTDEPIPAIAARAGFSDQSHLTRQMGKSLGVTPAAYRRARA